MHVDFPAGSGSFEFYEGLRVLVPGSFAVAIYAGIGNTFGFVSGSSGLDLLPAVIGTLFVGLFLYFLDLPSQAAVFDFESPRQVLKAWNGVVPKGSSLLNIYYEVLDTEMPAGIRTRTYYLGAIYRIGFESIFLLTLPALGVLAVGSLAPHVGSSRDLDVSKLRHVVFGAAAALIATGAWSIASRCAEHKRKGRATSVSARLAATYRDVRDEISYPDRMALVVASALAAAAGRGHHSRIFFLFAIAISGGLWAIRYFRGLRRDNAGTPDRFTGTLLPERQNLHAVTAVVEFVVAALIVLTCVYTQAQSRGTMTPTAVTAWSAALFVACLLIHFRGHEKKLQGSYGTIRTWLLRNRQMIEENYYAKPQPLSAAPSANTP